MIVDKIVNDDDLISFLEHQYKQTNNLNFIAAAHSIDLYRRECEFLKWQVLNANQWISVKDRLPTEDEYLTHHADGLDTFKRLLIAYKTDIIEYQIGCYDGWKWMNQLGNRVIKDVVAWKPFETYEPPNTKGEYQCT